MTAFVTDDALLAAGPSWWPLITGTDPEEMTVRQKTQLVVQGKFGTGTLVLATGSVPEPRVDLVWSASLPQEEAALDGLLAVGPLLEVIPRFRGLTGQWLSLALPTRRLAYGVALLSGVVDREDGYRVLNDLLPAVELDPEGSSDFLYQINRPRFSRSGIEGLRINRVSKWSVSVARRVQVSLSISEKGSQLHPRAAGGESFFAVRLETDINTPAERQEPLVPELMRPIYDELQDLTVEIANEGDIK